MPTITAVLDQVLNGEPDRGFLILPEINRTVAGLGDPAAGGVDPEVVLAHAQGHAAPAWIDAAAKLIGNLGKIASIRLLAPAVAVPSAAARIAARSGDAQHPARIADIDAAAFRAGQHARQDRTQQAAQQRADRAAKGSQRADGAAKRLTANRSRPSRQAGPTGRCRPASCQARCRLSLPAKEKPAFCSLPLGPGLFTQRGAESRAGQTAAAIDQRTAADY